MLGSRAQGSGLRAQGSEFGVEGYTLESNVYGLGFGGNGVIEYLEQAWMQSSLSL